MGAALDAVRFGGLVCLTSTSGEQGELARLGQVAGQSCSAGLLASPCCGQLGQWGVVSESLIFRMPCSALPCPATPRAGTIAGGRDAANALALYGMHLAPVPSANEQVGSGAGRSSSCQYTLALQASWVLHTGCACVPCTHSRASLLLVLRLRCRLYRPSAPLPCLLWPLQGLRMLIGLAHREALARRLM